MSEMTELFTAGPTVDTVRRGLYYGVLFLFFLCGCAGLPPNAERAPSYAVRSTEDTLLGRAVAVRTVANPGKDGIFPLSSGQDAFAMRMVLAATAQRTLDLQYYIWKADTAGQMMFEQIWKAAERGVRVRLLLDDQVTRGLDGTLAALDAHPHIEVRLFNPYMTRSLRLVDVAVDFARINRRMHNKSFTADNQIAIVGGRNIANEYYGADPRIDFSDLDVAVVGPVVHQVSTEFDLYWNSESAYPVSRIIGPANPDDTIRMREGWDKVRQDPEAQRYSAHIQSTPLLQQLLDRSLPLEWTSAHIIYDDPKKVLQPPDRIETHLLERMQTAMGRPERELDLVSPYFVPGKEGTQALVALHARGVQVRVLTNALAATDAGPVHAGYRKYRLALLKGGVMLYELKPGIDAAKRRENADDSKQIAVGGSTGGSSGVSLHAKTFAVDRQRVFVGSFNLDPRSARLNTEMGVVIDSPALARRLSEVLDNRNLTDAYRLQLALDGDTLEWIESTAAGERVFTQEPETGLLRRMWIGFLSILPIESLL
jgi:putative cardiolipin synthase